MQICDYIINQYTIMVKEEKKNSFPTDYSAEGIPLEITRGIRIIFLYGYYYILTALSVTALSESITDMNFLANSLTFSASSGSSSSTASKL